MTAGDVLIVGAGPTGMALALLLHARGIPFRLIDKTSEPAKGSRALTVNPVTLYTFEELGIAKRAARRGKLLARASVQFRGKRLAAVDLNRLPYRNNRFVMLPQPITEALLAERLREQGVEIERGTELTGLESIPGEETVVASTVDVTGQPQRSQHRYVVGCDGPRSAVRQSQRIDFSGLDYPFHFVMADARAHWRGNQREGLYVVEDSGFLILLPLTATHHRVVVKVNGPLNQKPSFADVQDAVRACVGDRLSLSDPIWTSGAPFYNRLAASTRRGQVFLAGDAAHLFSPIGGFGMNTGIGHAFNLGWKLAYVMRGDAPANLLASYESERLTLARRLVAATDRSTSLIARLDRHEPRDDEQWLPLARNRPHLRALPYNLAGFSHSYETTPSGQAGRGLRVGCIAPFVDALRHPDAEGGALRGSHLLVVNLPVLGSSWAVLADALERAQRQYRRFLRVMVFTDAAAMSSSHGPFIWRAETTALTGRGFPGPGLCLVRPDFFVEFISGTEDHGKALIDHLQAHYLSAATPGDRAEGEAPPDRFQHRVNP